MNSHDPYLTIESAKKQNGELLAILKETLQIVRELARADDERCDGIQMGWSMSDKVADIQDRVEKLLGEN